MPEVYSRLWKEAKNKRQRNKSFVDHINLHRSNELVKVLPKADPATLDTFSNQELINRFVDKIMRRDPVTGKTFVNIVELYQLRKQANQAVDIASNHLPINEERIERLPK